MENTRLADFLAIIFLSTLLILTCLLAGERGIEATSLHTKIASLEQQLDNLRPIPRIEIERGTVYQSNGEIVVEGK